MKKICSVTINPVLYIAVLFLLLVSCKKTIADALVKPSTSKSSQQYTEYIIRKGSQFAEGNNYKKIHTKEIRFNAIFDSSCIYTSGDKINQGDINKLYGFSDCDPTHHRNSARFGWAWNGASLEIYAYCYANGKRSSKFLNTIKIGVNNSFHISVVKGDYVFDLNGEKTSMPRGCTGEYINGYQLYPYFGGDETAPHDIHIFIKGL